MLTCESSFDENSPAIIETQTDPELILRQLAPFSSNASRELKRQLSSDVSFVVPPNGKHHPFQSGSIEDIADEPTAITEECRLPPKIVCGTELNEAAIEYEVKGLFAHEMPVIGVYVDKRICPGFRYKVRYNGRAEELFDGQARVLLSVGMGYGKRLTFNGDTLNHNDNYFWSDSDPTGFAFSLEVVSSGDDFIIYNALSEPVGKVKVEAVIGHQEETDQQARIGSVCKTVRVILTCSIDYYQRHQLLDLHSKDLETVEGDVLVVKEKRARKAHVECIRNVSFSRLGLCSLQVD